MTYVLAFNIAPGRSGEFWNFMDDMAAPFWRRFPEVSSLKIYTVIGGPRLYEAHIELSDFAAFDRIRKNADWHIVSREFLSLVEDVSEHFLTKEKEYIELRPAA